MPRVLPSHAHIHTHTHTVSQPTVTIITSSEVSFAGSALTLTCRTQLSATVDSGVVVVATWKKAGQLISNSDRISISPSTEGSPGVYESTLTVEPASIVLHSGLYSCEVLVVSYPSSQYVLPATASAMEQITVQSKSER